LKHLIGSACGHMACHLKCGFCVATPSVGYYYKHLFQQHLGQLFDSETEYGKGNLRWLNAEKPRASPYTLYLPKRETKYCCPECQVCFNKLYYAEKHTKCLTKSFEKHEEIQILLNLTPQTAPFCDLSGCDLSGANVIVNIQPQGNAELTAWREKVYQKIIFNLLSEVNDKQEWTFWFNKLLEDDSIHERYKEMSSDECMPEDDKFNLEVDCGKEMKLLGLTEKQIKEVGRKKLPTRPD
jgi:hypothetical protein